MDQYFVIYPKKGKTIDELIHAELGHCREYAAGFELDDCFQQVGDSLDEVGDSALIVDMEGEIQYNIHRGGEDQKWITY